MRDSSLEAFENIKPNRETHYKEILKALNKIGSPAVARVIESHCELDYHAIMRRLSEMEAKGMIRVVGRDPKIKNRPLIWGLKY